MLPSLVRVGVGVRARARGRGRARAEVRVSCVSCVSVAASGLPADEARGAHDHVDAHAARDEHAADEADEEEGERARHEAREPRRRVPVDGLVEVALDDRRDGDAEHQRGREHQVVELAVALLPHVAVRLLRRGQQLRAELLKVLLRRGGDPAHVQLLVVLERRLVQLLAAVQTGQARAKGQGIEDRASVASHPQLRRRTRTTRSGFAQAPSEENLRWG
eukprot:scaffold28554_cov56-Phaeocystis_antarctica.AAC.2